MSTTTILFSNHKELNFSWWAEIIQVAEELDMNEYNYDSAT